MAVTGRVMDKALQPVYNIFCRKEIIRTMRCFFRDIPRSRIIILLLCLSAMVSCAPQEVKPPPKPAKIAVVLGAGAARGFAHIGVLKILEGNRVPVHMIVGTSAGSFVGSLYAYGFSAFQIQKIALSIDQNEIVDFTVPDNGFIRGERLEEYINTLVQKTPLEKMRFPFYAVATNLRSGQEVIFGTGNTGTAVRASCAIPGIFRSVRINNTTYVDGGVVSPVAVDAARRMGADVVIAVDIAADIDTKPPEGTIETILQAIGIMHARISVPQLSRADVVIRPNVGRISSADFDKRHDAVLEGEKAALEALPAIQSIIAKLKQSGRL
jgi:NTE family protein